jgi:uncharacterized protein Usg
MWELIDEPPELPELTRFLDWWSDNIEGTINSVEWAAVPIADHRTPRAVSGIIHFN